MPEDDEVVLRKTVNGFCNSDSCAGNIRTATKTVFGSGKIVIRCRRCNSADHFVEGGNPGLDPNWQLGDGPDETKDDSDKDTPYSKKKGRK